jgi:hypothetical protein
VTRMNSGEEQRLLFCTGTRPGLRKHSIVPANNTVLRLQAELLCYAPRTCYCCNSHSSVPHLE